MAAPRKDHVIVIGGGIIGLQCALTLLSAGYSVTVVAEHLPDSEASLRDGSYTSPWAGAHFRPHASANTAAADWEVQTYAHFTRLASPSSRGPHPSSVAALPFLNTFSATPSQVPPWWSTLPGSGFRQVPASSGAQYAYRMRSFTLNPSVYLAYVLNEARRKGLRTVRARVMPKGTGIEGLVRGAYDLVAAEAAATITAAGQRRLGVCAVVNATGLAARELVPDPDVFAVRGQTLLLRGELAEMRTHNYPAPSVPAEEGGRPAQTVVAVIPHVGTGTTVLGSTRWPGRSDAVEDKGDTEWLLEEGRRWCPELLGADGRFELLNVNVGLRPGRKSGPRVERESRQVDGVHVVHAYGHDGGGYQQSIGTANRVLELIEEVNPEKAKL